MTNSPPTFISCFSGIGGECLGTKSAGFVPRLAIENDPHIVKIYKANFPGIPVLGDIRGVTASDVFRETGLGIGGVDQMDFSSPCVDFSSANTRRTAFSPNNDLYIIAIRLMMAMQPKVAVFENVPSMADPKSREMFEWILREFARSNYWWDRRILNAANYGVPQLRRRMIFICVRKDLDKFPVFPKPVLGPRTPVGAVLPHIEVFKNTTFARNFYLASSEVMRTITTGVNWEFRDFGSTVWRSAKVWEIAKLMGWPPDYVWPPGTSVKHAFKGLGNAVPPPLSFAISDCIRKTILW